MRRWAVTIAFFIASLVVGFAITYGVTTYRVVAKSPFGLNLSTPVKPIERVFAGMVRLGEAEAVFRDCGTGTTTNLNASSRENLLQNETALINQLRTDSPSAGLTPPLDLAEAILCLRRNGTSVRSGAAGRSQGEPLTESGWPENSEPVLRQALSKMDQSCK
jgi:hypothetical protein